MQHRVKFTENYSNLSKQWRVCSGKKKQIEQAIRDHVQKEYLDKDIKPRVDGTPLSDKMSFRDIPIGDNKYLCFRQVFTTITREHNQIVIYPCIQDMIRTLEVVKKWTI